MNNEPATAAPGRTGARQPVPADARPSQPAATGSVWLALAALAWLATMLWSVAASLRSTGGNLVVAQTAMGLPAVIAAALVAGAGVGLGLHRLPGQRLAGRPVLGFGVTLAGGLLTGGAAATVVVGQEVGGSAGMALGAVIAAGATIGGALAGARVPAVVAAGVAASLAVFLLTGLRAFFDRDLLALFGAGQDPISVWDAQQRMAWVVSVVNGLVAGLVAFAYLRQATRGAVAPLRWPAYLAAGGAAGAALLVTEVITRLGGAQLLDLARSVSEFDNGFQTMAAKERVDSALTVLFVGALTAMIAFGRTLGPRNGPAQAGQPSGREAD